MQAMEGSSSNMRTTTTTLRTTVTSTSHHETSTGISLTMTWTGPRNSTGHGTMAVDGALELAGAEGGVSNISI